MESEKSVGIKICLYVEHNGPEMNSSIYMIEPPVDLVEYEEKQIDSDGFVVDAISPVIALEDNSEDCFISGSAMFNLGSRIYFFQGGDIPDIFFGCVDDLPDMPDESKLIVRVLDIDHPELKLFTVASLNAPKLTPCVFSAHGLIYVLGSVPHDSNLKPPSTTCHFFERYDPTLDKWEILPDPPLPFRQHHMDCATWFDCATVLEDRYVFVGNSTMVVVFDLDTQNWIYCLKQPPSYQMRFPCGSLYVDGSLYYLIGRDAWKVGMEFDRERLGVGREIDQERWGQDNCGCQVNLVKKGPLHLNDIKSLKGHCVLSKEEQLIATVKKLEPDYDSTLFTDRWREIFHLGGRFFCYVVTAWLVNCHAHSQPNCRGVWIKVFEEVPGSKHPHFRTLASFCYRIRTEFRNDASFIRCCAFGSVPDSWVKAPMKEKHVVTKERKVLKAEQSSHHEHGGGGKGQRDCNLEKSVAAPEEEIIRLKAELAKKDELLKAYEAVLAQKSLGKNIVLPVNV
ncbi:hypothetical protein OROHE_002167 [Orobanche hederae]